jgi:predicted CXXCH cytochrome family protein
MNGWSVKVTAVIAGVVALAAIAAVGFAADVPVVVPNATVEVTVKVPAGKTLAGGTLNVLDRELPLPAAGQKVLVEGLPARRIAVTIDARGVKGAKGSGRYLGVADVRTAPGTTVPAVVVLQEIGTIEAYCLGCHPGKGMPVKPDQIPRDNHVSGKELTGKYLDQVKEHNRKVEEQLKNKAPKPFRPILLEERKVKVEKKEVVKLFLTCESCHTAHLQTPWANLARAPFKEASDLCVGCHF